MGPTSHPAEPGAIAQLAERLDRTQEVGGSNPPSSIMSIEREYEIILGIAIVELLI
jgi:hypothetical protein